MTTIREIHQAWRAYPLASLSNIIGSGACLILAPHPDDESLGCGGLIAACVAAGRMPLICVLTDGAQSHPNSRAFPPDRIRAIRAREVRAATACLGLPANRIIMLDQPDTAAPHDGPRFDAIVARLTNLIRAETACTAILAPWRHDPHCDHEAASLAAAEAATATAIRHVAYPVWGWTLPPDTPIDATPTPGFRLPIGPFMPAKQAAIRSHQSQYGGLITDDPTGFELPPELLSVFDTPFETFIPA